MYLMEVYDHLLISETTGSIMRSRIKLQLSSCILHKRDMFFVVPSVRVLLPFIARWLFVA